MDPIAKIYVSTVLDTSGWEDDLRKAVARIDRIPSIKPRVDQSELHDLNKTLDLKQQHLKETIAFYNNNRIKPVIDTAGLDKELSRRINIEAEVSLKSVSISNIISKPFEVAIAIPKNIAVGALESAGKSVATGLSNVLSKEINGRFGNVIGSLKLLGDRAGEELVSALESKIVAGLSGDSKLAKKLKTLSPPAESIRGFIGSERVAIAANANRESISRADRLQKEAARKQVMPSYRAARSSSAEASNAFEVATFQAAKIVPGLQSEAAALAGKAVKAEVLLSKATTQASTIRLQKAIASYNNQAAKIDQQQATIVRNLQAARRNADSKEKELLALDSQIKLLSNAPLPKFYQDRLDAIAPNVKREQIPALQRGGTGKAQSAAYNALSNTIKLNTALYDRLSAGKASSRDIDDLGEEIRHAVDLSFGSLKGVENLRDRRVDPSKKVATTKADRAVLSRVNKELEAYPEDVRELERNAKLVAGRDSANYKQAKRVELLTSNVGVNGSKLVDGQQLLEGMGGLLKEKGAAPFKQRLFAKQVAAVYSDAPRFLKEVVDAQTIGLEPAKTDALLQDVATLDRKHQALKAKIFDELMGKNRKIGRFPVSLDRNRRNAKPPEAVQAELVLTAKERIMAPVIAMKDAEARALASIPFDLGYKAKGALQRGGKQLSGQAQKVLGGGARAYSGLKSAESALFSIAPYAAIPAKGMLQGAAGFAAMGAIPGLQGLAGGGVQALLSGGAGALGSVVGGMGGGLLESVGSSIAPLLAPAIAGKIATNLVVKSLESALPSDIKALNKRLKVQEKELKQLHGSAQPSDNISAASGIDVVRSLKDNIISGYKALDSAIVKGKASEVKRLTASLDSDTSKAMDVIKDSYKQYQVGSPERKEIGGFNRLLGKNRRKYEPRKIEQVADEVASNYDPEELSSLKEGVSSFVAKARNRRNASIVNKARLSAANADSAINNAEAQATIREQQSALARGEKASNAYGIKYGAESIGATPLHESLSTASKARAKIVSSLNQTGETVAIDDVPLKDSIKMFKVAEGRINKQLLEIDKLANVKSKPVDITSSLSGLATNIGVLIAGFVAIGVAASGIQKALDRASAEMSLRASSDTPDKYAKSMASITAYSEKLGLSTTEQIRQAAKFQASLKGTGLEGLADQLGQGVTTFGRLQGSNKEEIGRGKLAISQIASKPKLSAEELNQLAEAIPGFGELAASASGYSQGRLRTLAGKGKVMSGEILANLTPALSARVNAKDNDLANNPQTKIDKLSARFEDTQAKLGSALLVGLAPAAEGAANVIKFLNDNLMLLGTTGIVSMTMFVGKIIATQMAMQGLSVAALFTKEALIAVSAASVPLLAAAAIGALITASVSLFDAYNGNSSPTKKLVEGYEAAAKAAAEARGEIKKLDKDTSGVKLEGIDAVVGKLTELTNAGFGLVGRELKTTISDIKLQGLQEQDTKDLIKLGNFSKVPSVSKAQISSVNKRLESLKVDGKLANSLEPEAATNARAEKIQALESERVKLTQPLQASKIELEEKIKSLKSIQQSTTATQAAKDLAGVYLKETEPKLAQLNETLSSYSDNIVRVDDRLEKSVSNFSGLSLSLERLGEERANETVNLLAGSLYEGTKATLEFSNATSLLSSKVSLARNKLLEANSILSEERYAGTIAKLKAQNLLPQDLRDTSPDQYKRLTTAGVDPALLDAIRFANSAAEDLAKNTNAQNKLVAERKLALEKENQALVDNYKQQITASINTTAEIAKQSQAVRAANYSAALSNSIIGIQGAVGNYINSTIDIFKKLEEITTIKQGVADKQREAAIAKLKASDEKLSAEQQYSGTSVQEAATGQSNAKPAAPGGFSYSVTSKYGASHRHHDGANYMQLANGETVSKNRQLTVKDMVLTGGKNADIPAPMGGTVKTYTPRDNRGFGNEVNILDASGKIVSVLAHMDRLLVKTGDRVNAGDAVGKQGTTGHSTGVHLHVEMPRGMEAAYAQMIKTGGISTGDTYATTNASVYRPNSGKAIDGGTLDMRGKPISDNSMSIATRLTGKKGGIPYGSTVRMRNPKTGKTVDVTVNDTGGLGRGRGIDMTPAVAKALGMTPDGVQQVQAAVVKAPGTQSQFALGDGELFKKPDGSGAILGRTTAMTTGGTRTTAYASNMPSARTIAAPANNQLIDSTYQSKIDIADASLRASVDQANTAITTTQIEAQSIDFKRFQQKRIDDRKAAEAIRSKKQEQRLKAMSFGNSSTSKDTRKQQAENQFYVDEIRIKIKENEQDNKEELLELARQKRNFTKLSTSPSANAEQRQVAKELLADFPKLEKEQKELYKSTRAGLDQDIRLGRRAKMDLTRNQKIKSRQENNAAAVASQNSGIAIDEELLKKSEEYLKLNPYDYKYGDPLTMRKQIDFRKQKQAYESTLAKQQDDINALDPTAVNYNAQRKRLLEQRAKLSKENKFKTQNIDSTYQNANTIRQLERKEYADNIANQSISRSLESRRLLGNYEQAQGRTLKGAETIQSVEAAERNVKLQQQINDLKRAAATDPRLRPNLDIAIKEVQYQKQLLDYTSERVVWREREANLKSLTSEASSMALDARDLDVQRLNKSGNSYDARTLSGDVAKDRLKLEYDKQTRDLLDRQIANEADTSSPFYNETKLQLEAISQELDNINNKKLDALNKEFSQFQAVIDDTAREGTRVLSDMVSGKGIDNNSLNQLLVAPFKAINDQIAGFLGGQWSQFVSELLGGVVGELNNIMGQMGSASEPSGGNVFSTIFNGIASLFGGGGGDFPSFTSISGFAKGGKLGTITNDPGFSALPNVKQAMDRERLDSGGREPVVIIANKDEMVLTPEQTQHYLSSINNYASGGLIGNVQTAVSPPKSANIPKPSYTPLELKTTIINNVETVSVEQLNTAIANSQKQSRKAIDEYSRATQDRMQYNVDYRQSVGLL